MKQKNNHQNSNVESANKGGGEKKKRIMKYVTRQTDIIDTTYLGKCSNNGVYK